MLPVTKKDSLVRAKKTKEFRKLAKDYGFLEGESHSEFVHNEIKLNICFYPCNYGVKISNNGSEKPYYQSFDITKSEFLKLLDNIKTPK